MGITRDLIETSATRDEQGKISSGKWNAGFEAQMHVTALGKLGIVLAILPWGAWLELLTEQAPWPAA